MKQRVITPQISKCWCGADVGVLDWDHRMMYRAWCDNGHTLTNECGSQHRAICKWNNRIAALTASDVERLNKEAT